MLYEEDSASDSDSGVEEYTAKGLPSADQDDLLQDLSDDEFAEQSAGSDEDNRSDSNQEDESEEPYSSSDEDEEVGQ